MKNTKRAFRRHHRRRMIARAMKLPNLWNTPKEDRLQWALRLYKNRQKCSCWMCGHRRKWHGQTIQERRQSYGIELDMGNAILSETEMPETPAEIVPEESANQHCPQKGSQ